MEEKWRKSSREEKTINKRAEMKEERVAEVQVCETLEEVNIQALSCTGAEKRSPS